MFHISNCFLKTLSIIGATASSDIDVLVTHPTATKLPSLLHKIVETLTTKAHFITDTISIGDSKFMVNTKIILFSLIYSIFVYQGCLSN